jgi:hypothetical protein
MHKAFAKPIQVEHRSKEELKSPTGGHLLNGGTTLQENGPTASEVGNHQSSNPLGKLQDRQTKQGKNQDTEKTMQSDLHWYDTVRTISIIILISSCHQVHVSLDDDSTHALVH